MLAATALALAHSAPTLVACAFVLGSFPPGAVPLMLGRVNQAVADLPHVQQMAWGRATVAFALVQAAAGYLDGYLLTASGGNHRLLFLLAAAAFLSALVWDLLTSPPRLGIPAQYGESGK